MSRGLQLTVSVLKVLCLFGPEGADKLWPYVVSRRLKIKWARADEILCRLEKAGWVSSEWENINEEMAGRPRRRLYRITKEGDTAKREALESLTAPVD